jgi:hypothetical protein
MTLKVAPITQRYLAVDRLAELSILSALDPENRIPNPDLRKADSI